MAAETIRDVLIRIRIQQSSPTKLQAPDIGPAQQALDRATKASTDAFTREERAAIQAYSRITAEREKAATAAEKLADRTTRYADRIDPTGGNTLGNPAAYNERVRQQATQDELRASSALAAASRSRIEAYLQVGEGALRAARGVAFLSASTEEDMRVALQYIAAAQGLFDVYAGIATAVKGLTTIRGTQAVVTTGAAIAEGNLAAATAVTTTATWAQTAATTALNVALAANPATWALVAAGAVAAGVAYGATTQQTTQMEAAIAKSSKTLNDAGTDWQRLAEQARRGGEALAAAGLDFDNAVERIKLRGTKQFADPEETAAALRRRADTQLRELHDLNRRGMLGVGVEGATNLKIEENRIQQNLLRDEIKIREGVTAELQKQLQLAQDALETSKRTVEAEKARFATKEEKFGRLSPGDRGRLGELSKRVEWGEQISEQDALFLDQTGFGQGLSSAFFRKRGQESGSAEILGRLGEARDLEQARRNLDADLATRGEFLKDAQEKIRKMGEDQDKDIEALITLMAEKASLTAFVKRLGERVDQIEKQQVNRNVANAR